jgi:hypothetical protein
LVGDTKETFLPGDNNDFLLQECERRQQLKSETFRFIEKVNRLFDGLSYEILEQSKLSILTLSHCTR